jgi:UDPglucose 6-dehydrogenase
VQRILAEAGAPPEEVLVASNPEFLREGTSVRDFLSPNRVVIGCTNASVAVRVSDLYKRLQAPILVTDPASAEMIKYASNAFLATKISFVNAIANLCEAVDADVREVALGMGYDQRIGFEFLHPGPGYGGSCFPKDTAALLYAAETAGYDFSLLRGVVQVNTEQHERMVTKLTDLVGGDLAGVTIAVWGLTFKANTDDLRDSPALVIVRRLIDAGATVRAYDPAAGERAAELVSGLEIAADPYEVCDGARALAVLTEWDEFRWLSFDRVAEMLQTPAVLDARNILDPAALRRLGFTYEGVGRS